jgi:hypothetical protein
VADHLDCEDVAEIVPLNFAQALPTLPLVHAFRAVAGGLVRGGLPTRPLSVRKSPVCGGGSRSVRYSLHRERAWKNPSCYDSSHTPQTPASMSQELGIFGERWLFGVVICCADPRDRLRSRAARCRSYVVKLA